MSRPPMIKTCRTARKRESKVSKPTHGNPRNKQDRLPGSHGNALRHELRRPLVSFVNGRGRGAGSLGTGADRGKQGPRLLWHWTPPSFSGELAPLARVDPGATALGSASSLEPLSRAASRTNPQNGVLCCSERQWRIARDVDTGWCGQQRVANVAPFPHLSA